MITDRDKNILRFIEKYKMASIEVVQKIFFKNRKYGYNTARRRLNHMTSLGYLTRHRDAESNLNIYIWKEDKPIQPNQHRLIILNLLAELHQSGVTVEIFDIERFWMGGKIRSDAFTAFTIGNARYIYFVECQTSHNPHNLNKYDDLFATGEVQKLLQKDFFPRVLLISDVNYKVNLEHTSVVQIDAKLQPFALVLA